MMMSPHGCESQVVQKDDNVVHVAIPLDSSMDVDSNVVAEPKRQRRNTRQDGLYKIFVLVIVLLSFFQWREILMDTMVTTHHEEASSIVTSSAIYVDKGAGYVVFSNEKRSKVLQENPRMEPELLNTIVNDQWLALSPTERKRYVDMAQALQMEMMRQYVASAAAADQSVLHHQRGG